MNINNRLKRLESDVIDISNCTCSGYGEHVKIILTDGIYYDALKTGEYVSYQNSINKIQADARDANEPQTVMENCLQCGKEVKKRVVYLHLI
jgi:hypothetical protein